MSPLPSSQSVSARRVLGSAVRLGARRGALGHAGASGGVLAGAGAPFAGDSVLSDRLAQM